ncbi:MAG: hypothetical protein ACKN97_09575 [Acidobacteriota bacterium]
MKAKLLLVLALLSSAAFSANAQSADKIFKNALKAMGGKPVQALRSEVQSGTIVRTDNGTSGTFLIQSSKPNLYHVKYDVGGFETEFGYNGKSAWLRDSASGLRTLTGESSIDMQAEAVYRSNLWFDYKKEKKKAVLCGQTIIAGKPALCVALSTPKGATIKIHFDSVTNLPIREEFQVGDQLRFHDYSDYRLVNGMQRAFAMDMRIGEVLYQVRFADVRQNVDVARADFDFPKLSGEPLPEIASLLREIQKNEDKVEEMLENYSYTQKTIRRDLGKDGVLRETESETIQLSFYKGYRITRMIEKNGKPLDAKDQADEDRSVEKRVREIEELIAKEEKRAVKQSVAGPPSGEGRRVSIAEVLRASNLINPRRERFRGRDVIVFDFEPNPNFDYKNAKSFLKFFGKCAGVMWIDEKDKQVARIDAVLFDSYKVGGGLLANLQKGASFTLEQERVNDEIWLPSSADINLSVKVLLVKGINVNSVIKSYNYSKFSTEVKDASVTEIKK